MKPIFLIYLSGTLFLLSCNSNNKKNINPVTDTSSEKINNKKEVIVPVKKEKPPIINIVDTISTKKIIVYFKDSASSFDRISMKLGRIYGLKLGECLRKNSIKPTGAPMAWYLTNKPPYFFEAGIAVSKKPTKLISGAKVKELKADSVVVAHFFGPYDLTKVGYDALHDWMKDHQKKLNGTPYEIYIGDPIDKKGKPVDPYRVQTDIVFPIK